MIRRRPMHSGGRCPEHGPSIAGLLGHRWRSARTGPLAGGRPAGRSSWTLAGRTGRSAVGRDSPSQIEEGSSVREGSRGGDPCDQVFTFDVRGQAGLTLRIVDRAAMVAPCR
jgi:hypothetical protein